MIACERRKRCSRAHGKTKNTHPRVSGTERHRRRRVRPVRVIYAKRFAISCVEKAARCRRDAPRRAEPPPPSSLVQSSRSCLRLGRESRSLFGRGTHGSFARSWEPHLSFPVPFPSLSRGPFVLHLLLSVSPRVLVSQSRSAKTHSTMLTDDTAFLIKFD